MLQVSKMTILKFLLTIYHLLIEHVDEEFHGLNVVNIFFYDGHARLYVPNNAYHVEAS